MAFQGDSIYWVEVEKVVPNPFQPRREFDQNKLQELADSIRMYGVLQPLTVTRSEVQRDDGTFYTEYELIAGERRLRASKLAGTPQVPVIIREGEQNEQEKLELAIIENLQREDLNAVDRAVAFKQLAEVFGLSHALVAQKVGRSREYVSNSIRLLGLPEHMLDSLKRSDMMEGHARTLLMLTDRPEEQEVVYKEILLKKLSVREVERIVRKIATDKVRKRNPGDFDANLIEMEKRFTETLGTRVQILKTDFGGKLTIDYFTEDDLEEILKRVKEVESAGNNITKESVELLNQKTPLEIEEQVETVTVENPENPEVPSELANPDLITDYNPEFNTENQTAEGHDQVEEDVEVDAQSFQTFLQPTTHLEVPETEVYQPEVVEENIVDRPVVPVEDDTFPVKESVVEPVQPIHSIPQAMSLPATPQSYSNQSEAPQEYKPVVSEAPITPTPTPVPEAPYETHPEVKVQEDDSNLYSINRFTI